MTEPTEPQRKEITLTRMLDAPCELVFAAFTDADRLIRWWGPEPFDVARAVSDPRPGGEYTIVMRSPEGMELPMSGTVTEIDPPRLLVTRTVATGPSGEPLIETDIRVELVDHDGKTEVTVHAAALALVPDADPMLAGMELGWVQTLRRLDDHVTGAADRQFVLTRLLEASPERVFEAWVDPGQVVAWWGPDGFTTSTDEMDVRPGGVWRFTMHGPDGVDYPNRIVFHEVVSGRLLVYTHDGGEDDDDPPFRTTVTFDPYLGNTVLSMRAVFGSTEHRDDVVRRYDAIEGGNQTLDRLVAFVAGRRGKGEDR